MMSSPSTLNPILQPPQPPGRDGYPANWIDIAQAMKQWAGWKCEACNHPHHFDSYHILTVHHLDRNPMNCAWTNLLVCCQRCHLTIQAAYQPGQAWLFNRPEWAKRRGL